ncbi:MAG: hypothetical protein LQ337_006603 [Flavoplaca oasis]|nr:MAG: hypothetical protein LQ337_006603 [Flavoplaca oasis]
MVVPKASTRLATGLLNTSGGRLRAVARTRSWQRIQRRHYPASEAHGSHKSSSDLPWAIGAALVTIPSVGYLIQPQLNKSSGHGHDGGGHGEHGEHDGHEGTGEGEEKSEGDQDPEAEKSEGGEDAPDGDSTRDENGEDGSVEQSTGSGSDDRPRPDHSVQDAGQGSPETSGGEDPNAGAYEVDSGSNVEGVRFKGATSGGTREGEQGDTRKHIPDPKGFNKKRIQSHYAKDQGVLEEEDSGGTDKAAPSKPPSGANTTSQKQEGLTNTNTRHSTDLDNNPDKSKKGEGVVETAKVKGSVDPGRPQAENRSGKENATGSQSGDS